MQDCLQGECAYGFTWKLHHSRWLVFMKPSQTTIEVIKLEVPVLHLAGSLACDFQLVRSACYRTSPYKVRLPDRNTVESRIFWTLMLGLYVPRSPILIPFFTKFCDCFQYWPVSQLFSFFCYCADYCQLSHTACFIKWRYCLHAV
jgi:hypothetical protein